VLSLILLFLLWQIRLVRLRGGSATGLSWIYFFFAAFCFVANFNALYTRFMRTDIYTTELRDINEKFNDLETNVESKLNYSVADGKTRSAIRSEINLLKIQITDPKNTGIGTEARQIIGRIEKLIGKKVTPLTPINQSPSGYQDLADRMEEQIIQMVYNLSPEEKNLMTDINNAVLRWNKDIQSLLLLSQNEIDDELIVIIYYPGKDRCNGMERYSTWNIFDRDYLKKLNKISDVSHHWIYKDDENLKYYYQKKIGWKKDSNQLIEKMFFKYHYPCFSCVVINSKGNFIANYGEFGKQTVWEISEELKNIE
jgi:hypothetical protein